MSTGMPGLGVRVDRRLIARPRMWPAVWRRLWRSLFFASRNWVMGRLGGKGEAVRGENVPRWRIWEVEGEERTMWTWNVVSGCGAAVCIVPLSLGWPPPV